jgi:hypothetical protein
MEYPAPPSNRNINPFSAGIVNSQVTMDALFTPVFLK